MRILSAAELEAQTALELPDRELLGALIYMSANSPIGLSVLENVLNHSFNHWSISVLNDNAVKIQVQDNLTQTDLDVFCNEATSVLSAQCRAELI